MRKILLLLGVLLLSAFSAMAAESNESDSVFSYAGLLRKYVGLRYGIMKGYTLYHIDFLGGASELEFPLNTSYWGVDIDLQQKDSPQDLKYRARFQFNWLVNGDKEAGDLQDKDWIDDDITFQRLAYGSTITQNHSGVDIYSESKANVTATLMDFHYYYNLYPKEIISLGPVVGYLVQKFNFDVRDLRQTGYGPYAPFETFSVRGKVLEYEVCYKIIYFGVGFDIGDMENFDFYGDIGYSPWTKAKDRDDHVLREKLSQASAEGYAYLGRVMFDWKFSGRWSVSMQGQYTDIHTTGIQEQSYYGSSDTGYVYEVDDIISSHLWISSAAIKYLF